jgi:hypothetical protein
MFNKVTTFVLIVVVASLFKGCEVASEGFSFLSSDNSIKEQEVVSYKSYSSSNSVKLSRKVFHLVQRVSSSADDAKETYEGRVDTKSNTIEIVEDGDIQQIVGVRFRNIQIPRGANILKAYIQFTPSDNSVDIADLNIQIQQNPNPKEFKEEYFNISDRKLFNKSVNWNPSIWGATKRGSINETTNDLSEIVQQAVNQRGWRRGNSIVFVISGEGSKEAFTFDESKDKAPKLYIEYKLPSK